MTRSLLKYSFVVILITTSTPLNVFAAGTSEDHHIISVGAGIASPSTTSSVSENPAGLVYNQNLKLLGFGYTENSSPGITDGGGAFLIGNGSVGGGAKVETSSGTSNLTAGIGFDISSINTAFGAACGTQLGPKVSINCSDFGLIYNPAGNTRFGFDIQTSGNALLGTGLTHDLTQDVTIDLDAGIPTSGGGVTLKPGVVIHTQVVQVALGYGFNASSSGSAGNIRTGFSAGLGVTLNKTFQIESYYNQLHNYFFGLVAHF